MTPTAGNLFTELDNLVLHLKGLVLARDLRRRSGADEQELGMFTSEVDRARETLAGYIRRERQSLAA
jgi:hypothetical protein